MTIPRPPRVYLDVCCLNRPFDDQRQERVRQEARVVVRLLNDVRRGQVTWVSSEVVESEIQQTRTPERRRVLARILIRSHERVAITKGIAERTTSIARLGFHAEDAAHLVCAEAAGVDVFLTTDDRLLRVARRHFATLGVRVMNPLSWAAEQGDERGR